MEQITPELERRIQVEEIWARRIVLADSINAYRRERFTQRWSLLCHFETESMDGLTPNAVDVRNNRPPLFEDPSRLPPASSVINFAAKPNAAGSGWRAAVPITCFIAFALVAAVSWHETEVPNYVKSLLFPPRAEVVLSPQKSMAVTQPARAVPAAQSGALDLPALRVEIAAKIAAAVGRDSHSPEMLQALQSEPLHSPEGR